MARHKKKKIIDVNKLPPNRNGRIYPDSLDYSTSIKFINTQSPSMSKVIGLFIRNKVVEMLTLLIEILMALIGVVLICSVGYGFVLGIGWLVKLFPAMEAHSCASLGTAVLYIIFILILLGIIVHAVVSRLVYWIKSNWHKAKRGEKVNFFED